jgi:hypothetical protein
MVSIPERYIVGWDGSPGASAALDWALAQARGTHSKFISYTQFSPFRRDRTAESPLIKASTTTLRKQFSLWVSTTPRSMPPMST